MHDTIRAHKKDEKEHQWQKIGQFQVLLQIQ